MTIAPSRSFHNADPIKVSQTQEKPRGSVVQKSLQKHLVNIADTKEVMTYRQFFARRWQKFICENFQTPTQAAAAFGVTAMTATNWFQGYNAPQGWVVAKAMSHPDLQDQAIKHLTGQQQCEKYAAE